MKMRDWLLSLEHGTEAVGCAHYPECVCHELLELERHLSCMDKEPMIISGICLRTKNIVCQIVRNEKLMPLTSQMFSRLMEMSETLCSCERKEEKQNKPLTRGWDITARDMTKLRLVEEQATNRNEWGRCIATHVCKGALRWKRETIKCSFIFIRSDSVSLRAWSKTQWSPEESFHWPQWALDQALNLESEAWL